MPETTTTAPSIIEPYTYYHSADRKRAFLVVDVEDPTDPTDFFVKEGRVVLIEWGKSRREAVQHNLDAFRQLVAVGSLILFTPKI